MPLTNDEVQKQIKQLGQNRKKLYAEIQEVKNSQQLLWNLSIDKFHEELENHKNTISKVVVKAQTLLADYISLRNLVEQSMVAANAKPDAYKVFYATLKNQLIKAKNIRKDFHEFTITFARQARIHEQTMQQREKQTQQIKDTELRKQNKAGQSDLIIQQASAQKEKASRLWQQYSEIGNEEEFWQQYEASLALAKAGQQATYIEASVSSITKESN